MVVQAGLFICVNVLIEGRGQNSVKQERTGFSKRRQDKSGEKRGAEKKCSSQSRFFFNHYKTKMRNNGNVIHIYIKFNLFNFTDIYIIQGRICEVH